MRKCDSSGAHLIVKRVDHVRETSKLKEDKEDELTGEMLPQKEVALILIAHGIVGAMLLRRLHGQDTKVNQLFLKNWTSLLHLSKNQLDEHHYFTCKNTTRNYSIQCCYDDDRGRADFKLTVQSKKRIGATFGTI
jgi:hypothetical protein